MSIFQNTHYSRFALVSDGQIIIIDNKMTYKVDGFAIDFNYSGNRFVVLDTDSLTLYRTDNYEILFQLNGYFPPDSLLKIAKTDMISVTFEDQICIHRPNLEEVERIDTDTDVISSWSPAGNCIAFVDEPNDVTANVVSITNVGTRDQIRIFPIADPTYDSESAEICENWVRGVTYSRDGSKIIVYGAHRLVVYSNFMVQRVYNFDKIIGKVIACCNYIAFMLSDDLYCGIQIEFPDFSNVNRFLQINNLVSFDIDCSEELIYCITESVSIIGNPKIDVKIIDNMGESILNYNIAGINDKYTEIVVASIQTVVSFNPILNKNV